MPRSLLVSGPSFQALEAYLCVESEHPDKTCIRLKPSIAAVDRAMPTVASAEHLAPNPENLGGVISFIRQCLRAGVGPEEMPWLVQSGHEDLSSIPRTGEQGGGAKHCGP